MRLAAVLLMIVPLAACAKKPVTPPTPPPPPPVVVRSQRPSAKALVIEHCVVTNQENANTVTCECDQVNTRLDSKTGHTTYICRAVREKPAAK